MEKLDKVIQEEKDKKKGELMVGEKRESGVVGSEVYAYYFKSSGLLSAISIIATNILVVVGSYAVNYWVGSWQADTFNLSRSTYIWVYILLGVATCVIAIIQSIIFGLVARNASMKIYKTINWNILRRPMRFFDTTPSGVILNRCVNDVA